jgi:RNA polymerase sigma-70 factor (sigma-E family)
MSAGRRRLVVHPADGAHAPAWSADDAVTRLYATQYRPLVRLATLLTHDAGLAEEVVQDSFVALHHRWGRLREPDAGAAYLRQSVVNRCRSALRHRGVVERFWRRQAATDQTDRHSPLAPSAETLAIAAGVHAEVLAAVRTLPARQREALVLRYYLDLSEAQTADLMGLSTGAVKSHTARALSALRRDLGAAAPSDAPLRKLRDREPPR